MRALLIDPFSQSISEVDYDGQWQSIAQLIAIGSRPFTLVRMANRHHIYLDDEGLYQPLQRFFKLKQYPQPLAGRGLVLRDGEDGDETPASIGVEELQSLILWLPPSIRFTGTTTREGEIDHPILGKLDVIESTPRFIDTKRMN